MRRTNCQRHMTRADAWQNPRRAPTFQPLYMQIKDLRMERIHSGGGSPGTFIPSEAALASTYQVSVCTLRTLQIVRIALDYQGRAIEKRVSEVSTQRHCYTNRI